MGRATEDGDSLWWLAASPAVWVVHLLASYLTVALWCEKVVGRQGKLDEAGRAIVVYGVVALGLIVAVAVRSYRRHREGAGVVPHDFDTRADRRRFLGFAALLLSIMSAVGVVYVSLPAFFIGSCQ